MKKKVCLILAGLAISGICFAAPTATVTFGMGGNRFYTDVDLETLTDAGWYIEIILQENNVAYNENNYASYLTIPGLANSYATYNETGASFDGATLTDGRAAMLWEYSTTDYVGYYATYRFYNDASIENASKYGVLPTWYQITAVPSEDDPRPGNADQTILFAIGDKSYTQYTVPVIPEPTTMALFGLGGLAMVLRRKMRKEG